MQECRFKPFHWIAALTVTWSYEQFFIQIVETSWKSSKVTQESNQSEMDGTCLYSTFIPHFRKCFPPWERRLWDFVFSVKWLLFIHSKYEDLLTSLMSEWGSHVLALATGATLKVRKCAFGTAEVTNLCQVSRGPALCTAVAYLTKDR